MKNSYELTDLTGMTGPGDKILKFATVADLKSALDKAEVNWRNWTNAITKTPEELWRQIDRGETVIVLRRNDLIRIVESVAVDILYPITEGTIQFLRESRQVINRENHIRPTRHTLTGKKASGKDDIRALVNSMRRKLLMRCEKVILANIRSGENLNRAISRIHRYREDLKDAFIVFRMKVYQNNSNGEMKSFPGLPTERQHHWLLCVIPEYCYQTGGYRIVRKTSVGRKTVVYEWTLFKNTKINLFRGHPD